jgi:hypothetical protein
MSRSKRAPIVTEGYGGKARKIAKKQAARSVRASGEVADGSTYKKLFQSWDICDFKIPDTNSNPKARRK